MDFEHATDFGQVVREIQYSRSGVTVKTEDGSIYEANYLILSVSIGVLQSDLISFRPPLPVCILLYICKEFTYRCTYDPFFSDIYVPSNNVSLKRLKSTKHLCFKI